MGAVLTRSCLNLNFFCDIAPIGGIQGMSVVAKRLKQK